MFNTKCLIILLICSNIINGFLLKKLNDKENYKNHNFYKEILNQIKTQKTYDGLIVMQETRSQDPRLQAIYTLREPKIILTNSSSLYYKGQFNSDIMTVVIMEQEFEQKMWHDFSNILNSMRQVRVLIIASNIYNKEQFKRNVLLHCEKFKFTNVLLHFINSSSADLTPDYYHLIPYPKYHLKLKHFAKDSKEYFPTQWLDMKGKTLLTLPDQNMPRSVMYRDIKGQLQFSGFAAKLILLFAQVFNATLKMPYQPKINEVIHYSVLLNMTQEGKLDMPMSVHPVFSSRTLKQLSYITEVSKWRIMVPCGRRMKVSQVYEAILSPQLLFIVIFFTITFSLVHTVIEKLFYNQMIWQNLLMSDKVIPGILGQSFALKKSSLISLRLIYILLFIMGVYNSTIFSAHLQTLITSPPFQRTITTFEEVRQSGNKILMNRLDITNMEGNEYLVKEKMAGIIEYTDNATLYSEYRKNFNTTYGYGVTTGLWQIFANIQLYYAQKVFCVTDDLNLQDVIPFGVPLGEHSPYREAMNYVIHKVHTAGLIDAWRSQVYIDLLKSKTITLRDSSRAKTYEDLNEDDLLLVWLILIVGLMFSSNGGSAVQGFNTK
ncbi:uncharacterized protein LOC119600435 [Lucilia sericata]|uniref:uncharacterized protein LOC119600435 n=1 Tax=Lucilia sericata TaxID=13632 RepID=UPI0018A87F10|nr:uncharacterized protein LOC119600435 [Lucilia sericata]